MKDENALAATTAAAPSAPRRCVVLLALPRRDRQPLPFPLMDRTSGLHDLAGVISNMRDTTDDGLGDGVGFAANQDRSRHVLGLQRQDRCGEKLPTAVEAVDQRGPVAFPVLEFGVAITSWFFAIGRQKIGPATLQIPSQMPEDHCDAVHVRRRPHVHFLIRQLSDRRINHPPMRADHLRGCCDPEIVIVGHGLLPSVAMSAANQTSLSI